MSQGIEIVYDIPHMDGSEGLIAVIIRRTYAPKEGARFVTEPEHGLQVGTLKYPDQHFIPPHRHIENVRTIRRTQEFIQVRHGSCQVHLFNSCGTFLTDALLVEGDSILLLGGAHSLRIYGHTELLEIKNGPYPGREKDKVEIKVTHE